MKGKVYLVGAGPGSPGLITVRGFEVLKKADVILYDRLVHPHLLSHSPQSKKIYCGKKPGRHVWDQEKINQTLIVEANKGKTVVRLKGGDPFIVGRVGEEAQALSGAGRPFGIIPGVSSAVGVPAYFGIPLTHRSKSSTVAIVTGRQDPTAPSSPIDWEKISSVETIVILMGVKHLPQIIEKVRKKRSSETPVAIISWGTYAHQKVLKGTLKNIKEKYYKAKIKPPSVIVIGQVVNLSYIFSSLENFLFAGVRAILIGPEDRLKNFQGKLLDLGFRLEEYSYQKKVSFQIKKEIDELTRYEWIVFSDCEAVDGFISALRYKGYDYRKLFGYKLGVTNNQTFDHLKKLGFYADKIIQIANKLPAKTLLINSFRYSDTISHSNTVCAFDFLPKSSNINFQRFKRVDFVFLLASSGSFKHFSEVEKMLYEEGNPNNFDMLSECSL